MKIPMTEFLKSQEIYKKQHKIKKEIYETSKCIYKM